MNQFSQKQWQEYIANTQSQPPHETCQIAVQQLINSPQFKKQILNAVDLGCGAGRDLRFINECGFKVFGVDSNAEILEVSKSFLTQTNDISIQVVKMENYFWPEEPVHLINASASLPFIQPKDFTDFWFRLNQKLEIGGLFSGHLFGTNDSWCGKKDFTFFNKEQILELFNNYEWIHFKESEYDGPSGSEPNKHWHRFDLVAKKINPKSTI